MSNVLCSCIVLQAHSLSLLMQCPYGSLVYSDCSNNSVAIAFQNVEHSMRGLITPVTAVAAVSALGRPLIKCCLQRAYNLWLKGAGIDGIGTINVSTCSYKRQVLRIASMIRRVAHGNVGHDNY